MAQDITDDQLAPGLVGGCDHGLGIGSGDCQRFFEEDVSPGLKGADGITGVGVWIGVNADDLGPHGGQPIFKAGEEGKPAAERLVEGLPAFRAARDETGDFKIFDLLVGAGMRSTHTAAADD